MEEISSLNLGKAKMNASGPPDNITPIGKGRLPDTPEEEHKGIISTIFDGLFNGTPKSALKHVGNNVIGPAIRTLIYQTIQGFFGAWIFGGNKTFNGNTSLSDYSDQSTFLIMNGRPTASQHKKKVLENDAGRRCRSVLFDTPTEANQILDYLKSQIREYGAVTVYTFLSASQVPCDYTMQNWGWDDLSMAYVQQGPEGFTIDFPDPRPIKTID